MPMIKMMVKHIRTCHSHCCISCRTQPLLLNQLLNASVFCSEPHLFSLPVERFFNRGAGPLATAWPGGATACRSSVQRSAPLDGAETVATLELMKPKRAYHQSTRELRADTATNGWRRARRKGANREMLAMCSYPFCERSATLLARQASRPVCDAADLRQRPSNVA